MFGGGLLAKGVRSFTGMGTQGANAIGRGFAWGVGGAALGGIAGAGYKAATGEGDPGSWAMTGALALGGLRGLSAMAGGRGSKLIKGLSNTQLRPSGQWGSNNLFNKNKLVENLSKMETWGADTANGFKWAQKMKTTNPLMHGRLTNAIAGAVPGAAIGAAAGAGYGLFSDRESMFSGAFKGAVLGAMGGAAFRNFKGGFNQLNKKFNPGVTANRAIHPITHKAPIGPATRSEWMAAGRAKVNMRKEAGFYSRQSARPIDSSISNRPAGQYKRISDARKTSQTKSSKQVEVGARQDPPLNMHQQKKARYKKGDAERRKIAREINLNSNSGIGSGIGSWGEGW